MRREQAAALDSLNGQLALKEAQVSRALFNSQGGSRIRVFGSNARF
jgi:hypothetical protein